MAYQPGQTKPEGSGRKVGSKNKTTGEIKNFLRELFVKNLPELQADLDRMKAVDKWKILLEFNKYHLPTLTEALKLEDGDNPDKGRVTIYVQYSGGEQNSEAALEQYKAALPDIKIVGDVYDDSEEIEAVYVPNELIEPSKAKPAKKNKAEQGPLLFDDI